MVACIGEANRGKEMKTNLQLGCARETIEKARRRKGILTTEGGMVHVRQCSLRDLNLTYAVRDMWHAYDCNSVVNVWKTLNQ